MKIAIEGLGVSQATLDKELDHWREKIRKLED